MTTPPPTDTTPRPNTSRRPRRLFLGGLASFVLLGLGLGLFCLDPWRWRGDPVPRTARDHWEAARRCLDDYDFAGARAHLQVCLEKWPLNAEAHFLMARTCRRLDDLTAWEAHLHKAEVLQWPPEKVVLEIHLRQAKTGDVRDVEAGLLTYLREAPPDEQVVREALAKGYLHIRALNAIVDLTDAWVARFPDDWQARLYRGRALQFFAPHREEAVREYLRVLEMKPDQDKARLWLAQVYSLEARYREALDHYQILVRDHPDHADGLYGLAHSQASLGQEDEARSTLGRLFARQPGHALGALLQAKLELAGGAPGRALPLLRQAEAALPYEPELVYNLAVALRRLGKKDEAERYQRRLQELTEQTALLDKLNQQIQDRRNDWELRYRAAVLCLQIGREADALREFQVILWNVPGHRASHTALADYYRQKGDAKRAEYHQTRAGGE
jgi:predicted Zn-dependent protease